MKVFIDYDSMLNDMSYSWLCYLNKEYGTSYVLEDVTHWEWFQELEVDAFKWFIDKVAFTEIRPLPLSQEFFSRVNSRFDTVILTASHPNMLEPKNEHILEYYGECKVIHHHAKWDYVDEEHVCILVDDRPMNCIKWAEAGGTAILFNHENDYRYADTDHEHENLLHATDYQMVERLLDRIKKEKDEG